MLKKHVVIIAAFILGVLIALWLSIDKQILFKKAITLMPTAKQIKISELEKELIRLIDGQLEFDFFGITSNGIDCIYFFWENGKFNIEFEAMIESQILYIDKLKKFAKENNFDFETKTYNNEPQYKSNNPAPVLRIETNANLEQITIISRIIQEKVFKNDTETIYNIVP